MARTSSVVENPVLEKPKHKTYTRWDAFKVLNLVPIEIQCNGYKPFHVADESCHSRLTLSAKSMISHTQAGHGGGFLIKVREGDAPWDGWQQLSDAGVEIVDLRCGECLNTVNVNPKDIHSHMQPHYANKRLKTSDSFFMTIELHKEVEFPEFQTEDE